jgi:hypothetical protein
LGQLQPLLGANHMLSETAQYVGYDTYSVFKLIAPQLTNSAQVYHEAADYFAFTL